MFEKVRKDVPTFLKYFVIFSIIFCLVFREESLLVNFRTLLSIFWLFYLPGYFLTLRLSNKFSLLERAIFGSMIAIAFTIFLNYFLGIAHVHIIYQIFIIPTILIGIGLYADFHFKKS